MPKLEEIYLCKNIIKKGENHITRIKSLRKWTNNLKEFSLCKHRTTIVDNHINDGESLVVKANNTISILTI